MKQGQKYITFGLLSLMFFKKEKKTHLPMEKYR